MTNQGMDAQAHPVCRLRFREDDGGFSTLGMVIALGLSLVLVFSGFRVYRVQSVSADIQDVADVAALAAENQVASFVSIARICDAAVLSFSLTGIVVALVGVAALCTPATAPYAEGLLQAARNIFTLRDRLSDRAAEALDIYQRCLPFLACVRAARVAAANSAANGGSYLAVALLSPTVGTEVGDFGTDDGAEEAVDSAREDTDDIRRRTEEAEAIAREADELKRQAWLLDCGDGGKTLWERASHLAGLQGSSNPRYASPDAWSFAVVISRCRSYYAQRLAAEERVVARSAEEAADGALRRRIYRYAVDEFRKAYARDTESGFVCHFPRLPRNMQELRETTLYTEAVYPMSRLADGTVMMHAHAGCPGASGCSGRGSIALLEGSERTTCPYCGFVPSSLANVCAATSVVNTGFEFYYRKIADLADKYAETRSRAEDAAAPAKRSVRKIMEELSHALKHLGGTRLSVRPPGSLGAIVLVVDPGQVAIGGPFSAALLGAETRLGARAAVSAATLVEDNGEGAPSVITGLPAALGLGGPDGTTDVGIAGRALGVVLHLWNGMVEVYNDGQQALERAAEGALDGFSWQSASGLGTWAAGLVRKLLKDAGLGAAPTGYLKPVMVNTALVAGADQTGWSQGYLTVKGLAVEGARAAEALSTLGGVFNGAAPDAERPALPEDGIVITIAQELLGGESPVTIAFTVLTGDETSAAGISTLGWMIGGLLGLAGTTREIKDWR